MRGFLSKMFLAAICLLSLMGARTVFAHADHDDGDEGSLVRVLTDETFEHLTQITTGATTGDWFIKFYAPWCGHCKNLQPAWEALAKRVKGRMSVAEVDCDGAGRATCAQFNIRGYPTLKLLKRGKLYTYKGARTEALLAAWAEDGYATHEPEPIPERMTPFRAIQKQFLELYDKLRDDLQDMMRTKPDLLVVVVMLSLMVGAFGASCGMCLCMRFSYMFDENPRKTVYMPKEHLRTTFDDDEDEAESETKPIAEKKSD